MLVELKQIAAGNIVSNIGFRQFVDIHPVAVDLDLFEQLVITFIHAVQVEFDKQRMRRPGQQLAGTAGRGRIRG